MLKLKDFFYLQRNDRQAILVLLGIIIVCITLVILVGRLSPNARNGDSEENFSEDVSYGTHAYMKNKRHGKYSKEQLYYKVDGVPHELFPFDPNTADSTQLLRLGLQSWQVRSIYRYRAKGGIFREPSDFARLYGLTKKQYEILAPYIIIGEDYRPAADYYGRNYNHYSKGKNYPYDRNGQSDPNGKGLSGKGMQENSMAGNGMTRNGLKGVAAATYSYPHKLKPGQHVNANTADTTEWMKIPGIGSYYAKSIVRYRQQLGGFVSPAQLAEIEGLPESAMAFISINPREIKTMNINKLTLNQLRQHPYLNFYQAKEICDYRRLKGPIHNLQELKLLKDFPPDEIERLKPYIEF